jgi:hypothetical protein
MALSIIHLDAAGNAIAIFLHAFVALPDDGEDLVPLAFEDRPHGIQPIGHAALVNDIQRARDILADAFAFA